MTIGVGELFTKVVAHLYEEEDKDNITAGLELVMLTRVKHGSDLAFGNKVNSLTLNKSKELVNLKQTQKGGHLLKGWKTKQYQANNNKNQEIPDPALDPTNNKTFNRGGQFLVDWCKDTVAERLPENCQLQGRDHNLASEKQPGFWRSLIEDIDWLQYGHNGQ